MEYGMFASRQPDDKVLRHRPAYFGVEMVVNPSQLADQGLRYYSNPP